MSAFPIILKSLRLNRKLTQKQLASALGISKSTVSMYENGNRDPSFEMLKKLADYFDVDSNLITGWEPLPVIRGNNEEIREILKIDQQEKSDLMKLVSDCSPKAVEAIGLITKLSDKRINQLLKFIRHVLLEDE